MLQRLDDALSTALDNPFWTSLASRHAAFGRRLGEIARYRADVAPFLGVAHAGVDAEAAVDVLVGEGEEVLLLGVAPSLSPAWSLTEHEPLAQMLCEAPLPEVAGPRITPLGPAHRDDVLDLVARVYPHYFRARTMELGRYIGIYQDGRLAAMAGERLAVPGASEISAVCTDPDYLGRGYARRLMAVLANDLIAAGRVPFLHVSQRNTRALDMYRQSGWRLRREIVFWSLRRAVPVDRDTPA